MQSAEVVRMRSDYAILMRVADGLLEMVRRGQACNLETFAHMAAEARAMAHRLASEIERILFETSAESTGSRAPGRKRSFMEAVRGIARTVCAAMVALVV